MKAAPAPAPVLAPARARLPSFAFLVLLSLLCAAPTAGDIGSCSEAPDPLDARAFFSERLSIECAHCQSCGISSTACTLACDPRTPIPASFPAGCHPLVHDGEVCLRAIDSLSCGDFSDVVGDAPAVPTECDFCPTEDQLQPDAAL